MPSIVASVGGFLMAKNVLIFSDGTGQGARSPKADCSNVWRLYEATCDAAPTRQIAYYDAGLGAPEHEDERSAWRTAYNFLSRATGLGISRNIRVADHVVSACPRRSILFDSAEAPTPCAAWLAS